jgi:hypothetical protein
VSHGIPLGCPLLLPVGAVNCVQTLKADEKEKARKLITKLAAADAGASTLKADLAALSTESSARADVVAKQARVLEEEKVAKALLTTELAATAAALADAETKGVELDSKLATAQQEVATHAAKLSTLQATLAAGDKTVAAAKKEREKLAKTTKEHDQEKEMLGNQLTNLAFMQLELMEDEQLKFKLRTEPVLQILGWAARARAKNDDSLPATQRVQSMYPPGETAPRQAGAASSGSDVGASASAGAGAGAGSPQKLTLPKRFSLQITKGLTGHGMSIDLIGALIIVQNVKSSSAAGKTNMIFPGMSIVRVNDSLTKGLTKKECEQLMKKSPKQMTLELERASAQ